MDGTVLMRILYAFSNDGMGHFTRSKAIIDYLKKKNQILIACNNPHYNLLKEHYKTTRIKTFNIVYKNNEVKRTRTFLKTIFNIIPLLFYNSKLISVIKNFKPDIIITDMEATTCYLANLLKIPLVSIDNQRILNTHELPIRKSLDYLIAKFTIRLNIPRANKYLVTSFFKGKKVCKKSTIIPPILRKEVLNTKPKTKNHILVYQTTTTNRLLLKTLRQTKEKYIIYGFKKEKTIDNLTLKKFNETQFLKDLSEAKAVIVNGGYTVMTEALYLNKPILANPINKQYEQIINAIMLNRLDYGKITHQVTKQNLNQFLNNLDFYKKNLRTFNRKECRNTFNLIEQHLKHLCTLSKAHSVSSSRQDELYHQFPVKESN